MTVTQQVITISMVVLGTMITRFLPFLVFRPDRPTPKYIQYIGVMLPSAVFGMLVVYCPLEKRQHFFGKSRDS